MADDTWECFADGPYVVTRWSGQETRKLCKPKNVGRANETTAEEQALREAAAKRAKRAKKEGRFIKPMLAQPFDAKKMKFPAMVQPKLDGVRCLAYWRDGEIVLQSRGGDPYDVEHIRRALAASLPKWATLDGELYIHGRSLQEIVSLVKRPQPGSEELEYRVYDIVDTAMAFEDRLERLLGLGLDQLRGLATCGTSMCSGRSALDKYEAACISSGFEGVIVRDPTATYQPGKRFRGLQKLKRWQDAEFEIVGWKRGEGKYANVPVLRCLCPQGGEFDCNPPGDMPERESLLSVADDLVGDFLTVRFFDRTDRGLPHYPVGVAFRDPGT